MGKNKALKEFEGAADAVGRRSGWWITALVLSLIGVGIWLLMSRQT